MKKDTINFCNCSNWSSVTEHFFTKRLAPIKSTLGRLFLYKFDSKAAATQVLGTLKAVGLHLHTTSLLAVNAIAFQNKFLQSPHRPASQSLTHDFSRKTSFPKETPESVIYYISFTFILSLLEGWSYLQLFTPLFMIK